MIDNNLTQFQNNVKSIAEQSNLSSLIEISINRQICAKGVTKKELKRLANLKNTLKNWTVEEMTIQDIAENLRKGYTIRPGIKIGGNTIENVDRASILLIDLDEQSVQETLETVWTADAAILYHTPSYEPGTNEKHRILFRLSRTVTPAEYEHIYKALLTFYKKADRVYSAGYLFFGASQTAGSVQILNESAVLDIEPFLQMEVEEETPPPDKPANTIKTTKESDKEGVRTAVLKWLSKEVWLGKCSNDINLLYCLHPHNFVYQGKDRNNLAKWGGHRPEDKAKTTGTGFFVFWQSPDLLPIFNNQGNAGLEKGTFIDYWHYYKRELYGKEWGSIVWQQDRQYKNYKLVCDDIAQHFDIKPFDFDAYVTKTKDKSKELEKDIIEQVKECLRTHVFLMKNGAKDNYLYYDFNSGLWRVKPEESQVYRDCVKRYLVLNCSAAIEVLDDIKVSGLIEHLIKRFDEYESIENKIQFDFKRNADVVPTANGEYNWKTREFTEEFNPKIYNTVRSLHNYEPVTNDSPGVKLLNYWLDEMKYTDSQKKAIKAWLIVNTLGIATRTNRMLNIFGTPETGKSVIGQIIKGCVGTSLSYMIRGKQLADGGNRFANQSLDGIYSLFIDEFKANAEGWESLKLLVGKDGSTIEIEKKSMSAYNTVNLAGITTATQDGFYIPNSDDGGIKRRICMIRHKPEQHNPKLAHIDQEFAKPGIYQDVFNWCIQQDGDKAVEDFVEYAKSEEATTLKAEVLYQNDPVLQFMEECIEITNNPEDCISRIELQSAYSTFLEVELGLPPDKQLRVDRAETYVRGKIASNSIKWDFEATTKVTINKKQVRGMKGIKLKTADDLI